MRRAAADPTKTNLLPAPRVDRVKFLFSHSDATPALARRDIFPSLRPTRIFIVARNGQISDETTFDFKARFAYDTALILHIMLFEV